jgi:hypothetical protein
MVFCCRPQELHQRYVSKLFSFSKLIDITFCTNGKKSIHLTSIDSFSSSIHLNGTFTITKKVIFKSLYKEHYLPLNKDKPVS